MTNETRERIKYYKNKLPHMKEKLVAAIMMLVAAATVTVTATYAWITLSSAPEVSNVETTVAANGSLEIALASGNGEIPGKSAEGDSTGAGTALSVSNTTWGNLINLSEDNVYGLSKITLRPAALNSAGLLTTPLYGVEYGEDGRISNRIYDENFAFAYYDAENKLFRADVEKDKHFGVRAITTVKYVNTQGASQFKQYSLSAKSAYQDAGAAYKVVTSNSRYIDSLQGLIQLYAQSVIDSTELKNIDVTPYMDHFYGMVSDLMNNVMIPMGQSYVYMANMWDLVTPDADGTTGYESVEELIAAYDAKTLPAYVTANIESLGDYISDYKRFKSELTMAGGYESVEYSQTTSYNLAYCKERAEKNERVYWTNIHNTVDWLCQISTATLDGYKLNELSSMSNAADVIMKKGTHQAVLHEGAIYCIDRRLEKTSSMLMKITVSVDVNQMMSRFNGIVQAFIKSMYPTGIVTFENVQLLSKANELYEKYDTNTVYYLPTETSAISSKNPDKFEGGEATAEDTYAMAIDLWVRTNAGSDGTVILPEESTTTTEDGKTIETIVAKSGEQAYLTLEGKTETISYEVAKTMKDADGNDQPKYSATYEIEVVDEEQVAESGTTEEQTKKISNTVEVFKFSDGKYYYVEKGKNVCLEDALKEQGLSDVEVTYTPMTETMVKVIGYQGVNRVWDETILNNPAYQIGEDEIRTTQGGGSCYIFYAETPADQSRFLKLLEAMKVVFVDAAGNQIGVASMDTEHYYADTGKVTVPLVLDEGQSIDLGLDSSGNPQYALMPLRKNAATRITAIVYLDGTKLTNDMVLASGDIQGALNIQFGSNVAYQKTTITKENGKTVDTKTEFESGQGSEAIEDEAVMKEKLKVTASVTKSEFTFDASNKEGYTTTLNVNVTGVKPNSVEARFIRAISSTQGVQQTKETLNSVDENKEAWNTTYTFTRPGNYVLRSVWIDGVEYSLAEPVTVVVKGSSINDLSWNQSSDGNKKTVFTSENTYSVKYILDLSNSGTMPKKVKGIILDKEGQQISVPFHYDTEEENWVGSNTYATSNTYTIQFVEIDGDYYELDENKQKILELHLGLKARTWVSASAETLKKLKEMNESYTPTNFGLTDEVTLQVSVEIYDNSDTEIKSMNGAVLNYQREGTTEADGRLDTNLNWSDLTGKYEGEFLVNIAGNYSFSNVTYAGSQITKCTDDTPSIRCVSLKPTYYVGSTTKEYQYAPDKPAVMEIQIANAGTANIIAELTNTYNHKVITVSGSSTRRTADISDGAGNQIITWEIDIATDDALQEGTWKLTNLKIYGAIYDGQFCTEEKPGEMIKTVNGEIINASTKESVEIITEVVKYLHVTVRGADESATKQFMEGFTAAGAIEVTATDYSGKPMKNATISSASVVYDLIENEVGLNTTNYAYEASDSTLLSNVTVTGNGNQKSDTEYTISGLKFTYPGPYKCSAVTVAATINGQNVKTKVFYETTDEQGNLATNRAPEYKLKLTKPTVTITGVTTGVNGTAAGKTFKDYVNGELIDTQNYFEDYYANVHTEAYYEQWHADYRYSLPRVHLKLDAAGKISASNKATFGYTYESSGARSNSVDFTSSSNVQLIVGDVDGKNTLSDWYEYRYLLNGSVDVETIDITNSEATFKLKLSHKITIRQIVESPKRITYIIPNDYVSYFNNDTVTYPRTEVCYDGRNSISPIKIDKIENTVLNVPQEITRDSTDLTTRIVARTDGDKQVGAYNTEFVVNDDFRYYDRREMSWTETSIIDFVYADIEVIGWKTADGNEYTTEQNIPLSQETSVTAIISVSKGEKARESEIRQRRFYGILDTEIKELYVRKDRTIKKHWLTGRIESTTIVYPNGYDKNNVLSGSDIHSNYDFYVDEDGNHWGYFEFDDWHSVTQ